MSDQDLINSIKNGNGIPVNTSSGNSSDGSSGNRTEQRSGDGGNRRDIFTRQGNKNREK